MIFRAHSSASFTASHCLPGDTIYVVDAVQDPLLLHEVSPGVHKTVGKCYVWDAMDLDYWNPGNYIGLWPDRPCDLGSH